MSLDSVLSPDLLSALAPFGRYGAQTDAPLAPHTSFRIGGPAAALLVVRNLADLAAALDVLHSSEQPFLILGGGSNVLISDAGVRGLVILNQCRRIEWREAGDRRPETGDQRSEIVRAEGGVLLAGLARAALVRGLAGLAWAVSVPGTVGGAVVGNSGAHDGCIADNLISAEIWQEGERFQLAAAELQYTYRSSCLKERVTRPGLGPVVLSAAFRLQQDVDGAQQAAAEAYVAHRRRTQPVDKSAGSMFKNPPGDFAGRLIEAAGLKGERVGGASVSTLHANFIINEGGATANDVVQLMDHMRGHVHAYSGIVLEPEIQFLGEWQRVPPLQPLAGGVKWT